MEHYHHITGTDYNADNLEYYGDKVAYDRNYKTGYEDGLEASKTENYKRGFKDGIQV